ncbi:MAG: hypothetical protein ACK5C0_10040 [Candidatus Kapaibacterium sp.]|jgi:hypothetical protein
MKTLFISALALFLSSQLFAQQWEKIQYPELLMKNINLSQPKLIVNNNILYAIPRFPYPPYFSKDNGTTWYVTDTNNLKSIARNVKSVSRIAFTNSSMVITIPGGLARSFDNGQTWQKIDFFSFVNNTIDTNILALTAYDRTVIVKTGVQDNVNAYISTDEGNTWKEMALPKNTFDGQLFKLYQNSIMYEGQFYDGKTLVRRPGQVNTTRMRFYLIPDIHNPLSQATTEFPVFIDFADKDEEYVDCSRLGIVGNNFTCNGDLTYLDGKWQYRATITPNPMTVVKDIDFYNVPYQYVYFAEERFPNYYDILGSYYDTPGNIFYGIIVRRKSDSAVVHRYVKQSSPYNGNFEILADDFVLPKDLIKSYNYMFLSAVTDNAVIIRNNNNELYRFQKSSVSVEVQVFDATKTLTLQPNPAKEQIHISFDTPVSGIYTCELHDMMGASIASLGSATLDKGQQWNFDHDIHTLPNGYYRLIIKHQSQVFSVPCIIHK